MQKQSSIKIAVIIASSLNRIEELFTRSLNSVKMQTRKPDFVLVVDDNENLETRKIIKSKIGKLAINDKNLFYIENFHAKGKSGTGAWNSAFDWYKNYLSQNDYIAILDDDDSWEKTYLCITGRFMI